LTLATLIRFRCLLERLFFASFRLGAGYVRAFTTVASLVHIFALLFILNANDLANGRPYFRAGEEKVDHLLFHRSLSDRSALGTITRLVRLHANGLGVAG
jgi:hypothetical protein